MTPTAPTFGANDRVALAATGLGVAPSDLAGWLAAPRPWRYPVPDCRAPEAKRCEALVACWRSWANPYEAAILFRELPARIAEILGEREADGTLPRAWTLRGGGSFRASPVALAEIGRRKLAERTVNARRENRHWRSESDIEHWLERFRRWHISIDEARASIADAIAWLGLRGRPRGKSVMPSLADRTSVDAVALRLMAIDAKPRSIREAARTLAIDPVELDRLVHSSRVPSWIDGDLRFVDVGEAFVALEDFRRHRDCPRIHPWRHTPRQWRGRPALRAARATDAVSPTSLTPHVAAGEHA